VPVAFEPAWRDLPPLAWVAARAYVPASLPAGVAVAAAGCSLLVWLPNLVSLRSGHRLAALDRCALVVVDRVGRRVRGHLCPAVAALACIVVTISALSVVAIGGAFAALGLGLGVDVALTVVYVVLGVPVAVAVLLLSPWRVVRSLPKVRAVTRWLGHQDPGAPVWRLAGLAAWPRGRGHGSALLARLAEAHSAGGYVVACPRDDAVRAWYRRLGMREHDAGALYLALPASDT
jgi:hypothetical protein